MSVISCPAFEHQLPEVQAIARRTIDANYRSFLGDEGVDWFINSGASDEYLLQNLNDCRVLEADGSIVGFCVLKGNLIDLMMVDHAHHRRGFGSTLLADCEALIFAEHAEVTLESYEGNEKANAFYRKHGYAVRDRVHDETAGQMKLVNCKRLQSL